VPNSINIPKSNITSSNESTDYITDSSYIHVKCKRKQKPSRHADILLQNNIPSCSNQDGGLRGDGFSWYSDEDFKENEQQEREKNPEWQTVSHKGKKG
jgi:hypothetical protein